MPHHLNIAWVVTRTQRGQLTVAGERDRSAIRDFNDLPIGAEHGQATLCHQLVLGIDHQIACPRIGFLTIQRTDGKPALARNGHIQRIAGLGHGARLKTAAWRHCGRAYAGLRTHIACDGHGTVIRQLLAKTGRVHVGQVVGNDVLLLQRALGAIHGGVNQAIHDSS